MARRRLGVALLLEHPLADQIDGLRRALGDRSLTRIVPHVTLISPVNVAQVDLGSALARLRDAAASLPGPLELTLGPPATFLPDNPVVYLPVTGDLSGLTQLHQEIFAPPLARPVTWPWVPHVTAADDIEIRRIGPALAALADFGAVTTVDRVVLLQEQREGTGVSSTRHWVPLADAALGPRHIVGRGGLPLELTTGRLVDPEAAALLGSLPELVQEPSRWEAVGSEAQSDPFPIVCTARREGHVVGLGAAWWSAWRGYLAVGVDPGCRHQGIGTAILGRIESLLADAAWSGPGLEVLGPPGFYRGRSPSSRS